MALKITDRISKIERLERYTRKIDNGCWLWEANTVDGYGVISINGIMLLTHRLSASLFLGLDINNPNIQANHKIICPNKNCWNPDHLYCGTSKDNAQDTITLGHNKNKYDTIYKDFCKNNHDQRIKENVGIRSNGNRICKLCAKDRYKKADIKRGKIKS